MPESDDKSASSKASNSSQSADHREPENKSANSRSLLERMEFFKPRADLLAYVLIAFGILALLNNLVPAFFSFDRVWPLLLVFIGMAILLSSGKKGK